MTRVTLIAVGLAAALALPAYAQGPDAGQPVAEPAIPSAPPATVTADDETLDPDKIVCRKAAPPTGTRIRGRSRTQLCMTKADWDQLAQDSQDAHRDMDDPSANREFLDGSPQ